MRRCATGLIVVALLSLQAGCGVGYGHRHGRAGFGAPGYGPPPGYAPPGYGRWYGMAGCGLGSVLFGPNDEPFAQVLAATTNGTFVLQTLSISSGTSNCVSGGVVHAEREQAAFAEVNFHDLKRNMAEGGGEYLRSFATLLGCDEAARPAFFKMAQDRYGTIVPSESTGPIELVVGVKTQMKADARLSTACSDERAVARARQGPRGDTIPARVAGGDLLRAGS